jgi:hypothetical protein
LGSRARRANSQRLAALPATGRDGRRALLLTFALVLAGLLLRVRLRSVP